MTKIRVSPLLFLMAAAMIFLGSFYQFVSYLVAVIMHEMAHAEVSKRLGYCLTDIKLMPHGASLTGAFEGVKWSDEFIIALAGPFSNLLIAVVFIAVWWLAPSAYFITETFVMCNIFTAVFNLIPIFPLDGGRALLAILSRKFLRQKVYRIMRYLGLVFAALFAILFGLSIMHKVNITFAVIAIFIFTGTIFPDKNCKYQRLYSLAYKSERLRQGLPVREVMVDGACSLLRLFRMLNANYFFRFNVCDSALNVIAQITELQLSKLMLVNSVDTSVREALKLSLKS